MKKATYLWALLLGFGVLLIGCEKQEQPASEPQNDAPFEIVITDKTQLSFTYNVTPLDKDMEYIFLSDTAENLAQKGVLNDDDIPALNFVNVTLLRSAVTSDVQLARAFDDGSTSELGNFT